MASFVHLRVKSAYSLLEGAIRPDELAELARENAMPAVAVTDTNNLFGVYEIVEKLTQKEKESRTGQKIPLTPVQPIVGALLSVALGRRCRRTPAAQPQEAAASAAPGAERGRLSQSHQAAQPCLSEGRARRLAACHRR